MRIIGLDPGTATTGYGIVDVVDGVMEMVTYGAFLTSPKDSPPARLQSLYHQLIAVLSETQPQSAGVEMLFFGRNVTTAISVGQARGVLLLALAEAGLPIGEYKPAQVKQAVTGYGNADKAQVQLMVRHLLDLEETPRPDDAADALAVAITHYNNQRFQALVDAQ